MPKLLLNYPRLLTLFVAIFSSMGALSAAPANGLTFKGTIYESPIPYLENSQIQYTLADGIFETIVSSPLNTFFTDGYSDFNDNPSLAITVVPQVVTEFKWLRGGALNPVEFEQSFEQSIFGITEDGLSLQILDPSQGQYRDIFISTIQAPEGLSLSACKTQDCDASANFWDAGYYSFRMTQTPVMESESVPEPSAAVALGLVSALFLKRRRKIVNIPAFATTHHE
ncbi:PEP-CTERM sorting domain-containing protein [Laspinema sp. D1]|uniref:PEP-CTERM sorting domain-containing protein n=1 Tax=Laspinema palackyanum D2a TaxID=2953684 RepID=A0ABT2MV61_9CYAN|nr:PEP-CTERM sorting domain-containing protein [Laspinema sp. D2a]